MTNNIPFEKLKLTDPRSYYRDFKYPWAYTFAEEHRRMNWTREEVRTLHEDVADWKSMTEEERAPRQFLLNYFVQADVDVAVAPSNEEFPQENSTSLEQGFDIRKLHKETQSTNPHYTDNHSKIMEDRQRRMERFSQLMKDKNGLDEVLRTPAYQAYDRNIDFKNYSSERESSSININENGLFANDNPYIHSNPD